MHLTLSSILSTGCLKVRTVAEEAAEAGSRRSRRRDAGGEGGAGAGQRAGPSPASWSLGAGPDGARCARCAVVPPVTLPVPPVTLPVTPVALPVTPVTPA